MAMAANATNTDVAKMGDTFKYVAPVAGALGYSIEDTAVAIGLMANNGIKASQAGTSLRSLLTNLTPVSYTHLPKKMCRRKAQVMNNGWCIQL